MPLSLFRSRAGRRVGLALLPATLLAAPLSTLAATPAAADTAMVPHEFYQSFSPANPTPNDTITTTTSISGCTGSYGAPVTFFLISGPTFLNARDYGSFSPDGDTYTVTHVWAPGTFQPGTYTMYGYGAGTPCFPGLAGYDSNTATMIVANVPASPGAPTATAGDGSVDLSWAAPANNGAAISDYTVQYSADGGASWTADTAAADASTSRTVHGLTNGTDYLFRIAATNVRGTSDFGPASDAVTPQPAATAPAAPTSVSATATNGGAELAITPGSNGGSPITGYQVSTNDGGTFTPLTTTGTGPLTATITGLTNGTSYALQVRAINTIGTGPAATAAAVTPATVPAAPQHLAAQPGDRAMVLSFDAPLSDGGSPILGYASSTDGGSSWQPLTTSGTGALTATLGGLQNMHPYSVLVRARNAQGSGDASAPATGTPRPLVPLSIGGPASGTSAPGGTVTIAGTAPVGSTVRIYFRQRNASTFTERRTLVASDTGTFSTTYLANDDYRYYAVADGQQTQWMLNQLTPSVEGPLEKVVRLGSTVTLRGKANPNSTVQIHFHKQGTPFGDYSIVRTVPVAADGSWTRQYAGTIDYRFFVTSDANGQASPSYLVQAR